MATKEEIHILQQQVRENESKLDQAQLKAEQAASQAQALELQVQIVKQEAEAACELLAKQAALQTADQEYQSNAMIAKEAAAAAKEMNRRIGTCKQVVKRMLQQHLAASWSSFYESVVQSKANRQGVDKVLKRMSHRSLALAFECYAAAVEVIECQREKVTKVIAQLRGKGLTKAFEAWVEFRDALLAEKEYRDALLAEKDAALIEAKHAADTARQREGEMQEKMRKIMEESVQQEAAEEQRERAAVAERLGKRDTRVNLREAAATAVSHTDPAGQQTGTHSKNRSDSLKAVLHGSLKAINESRRVTTHWDYGEISISDTRAPNSPPRATLSGKMWLDVGKSEEMAEALEGSLSSVEGLNITLTQAHAEHQHALSAAIAMHMQRELRETAARQGRWKVREEELLTLVSHLSAEVQRVRTRWEHSCLQLSGKMHMLETQVRNVCSCEAGRDKRGGTESGVGDASLGLNLVPPHHVTHDTRCCVVHAQAQTPTEEREKHLRERERERERVCARTRENDNARA
jgi:hypothetical protein